MPRMQRWIGAGAMRGLLLWSSLALLVGASSAQGQASGGERSVGGLLAAPAQPAPSIDPELDALARALDALAAIDARALPRLREAIEQGRAALRQARAAVLSKAGARAASKKRLLRAAIELGERIALRSEEERAAAAAEQRARAAERAHANAAQSLAQAEQRLAAVPKVAP